MLGGTLEQAEDTNYRLPFSLLAFTLPFFIAHSYIQHSARYSNRFLTLVDFPLLMLSRFPLLWYCSPSPRFECYISLERAVRYMSAAWVCARFVA